MGDWAVQQYYNPQSGPTANWNDIVEELIAGADSLHKTYTYRKDSDKYYNQKLKNMTSHGNNTRGSVRASGWDNDVLITDKPRVYQCDKVFGRKKRVKTESVVKSLMNEQTTLFQTLSNQIIVTGYSWQQNGINFLNSRYTLGGPDGEDAWPRRMLFPVYIYRLSSPNGQQTNQVTGDVNAAYPLIQYRLQGDQAVDGDTWVYSWIPVNPTSGAREGYADWNAQAPIVQETQFLCDKYLHDSSYVKLLMTAPTQRVVDCNIDIVQFTEDQYAPPDEYYQTVGGTSATQLDGAGPGLTDQGLLDQYYSSWLFNKISHPCVASHKPPGMVGPPPFKIIRRHKMAMGGRDTTNMDTAGFQYLHTDLIRGTWHNAIYPHYTQNFEGPNVDPTGGDVTQHVYEKTDNSGVFPEPHKALWLMVSAFGPPPREVGTNPNGATEPSFDISIRASFKCVQPAATHLAPDPPP